VHIRGIRLPQTEKFPCSRRRIKELFATDELVWVSFGSPIRSFRFDKQVAHRPKLVGPVVASLAMNRNLEAHLCVYPVRRAEYPEGAEDDLNSRVLPSIRDWLRAKTSRSGTGIHGHEEIVVEWTGTEHRCHELRFL